MDNKYVLTGSKDGTVILFDKITSKCLQKFKHDSPVTSVDMDESYIVTASEDGTAKLFNKLTGELI